MPRLRRCLKITHHVSFPSIYRHIRFASPVLRIDASPHMVMKTRIWPISNPLYPTMLHCVPVNIIDVTLEIPVIADQVFPISTLPYPTLAPSFPALGSFFTRLDFTGKPRFDQSPSCLIICVTIGQGPNAPAKRRSHLL